MFPKKAGPEVILGSCFPTRRKWAVIVIFPGLGQSVPIAFRPENKVSSSFLFPLDSWKRVCLSLMFSNTLHLALHSKLKTHGKNGTARILCISCIVLSSFSNLPRNGRVAGEAPSACAYYTTMETGVGVPSTHIQAGHGSIYP